jgi:hypothetical protein
LTPAHTTQIQFGALPKNTKTCLPSLEKDNNYYNLLGLGSGGDDCEVESFNSVWVDTDSEEERLEKLELKALRSLCGDLVEEIFDESSFPLSSELDEVGRKGKSHAKSYLNKICKSKRVKFSKKMAK